MKFIADLHMHSHYSAATSNSLVPEYLEYWAKIKGITVIGTGDFIHPGWLKELKEKLEPAEPGLFKLKSAYKNNISLPTPITCKDTPVRFLLTTELSNVYKKNGKVRKVHNLILAPNFETVEKTQYQLLRLGFNISYDGRPILGLDSKNLLEISLEASQDILLVPAHIWTPWFSVLGSQSGFDSIKECYDDLSRYVFALETGLSSDPPMNWMCSFLDDYTLISNSDAHSPEKLGRNANIFNTDLSYYAITQAIKTANPEYFLGTIDMFPQEGKYHFDGHRKCNICWTPIETIKHNTICSVCKNPVTVGVMHRVAKLSDRHTFTEKKNRIPYYSTIPLKEILSEIKGTGPNSKKVAAIYTDLIEKIGSEFDILLNLSIDQIEKYGDEMLVEAIRRIRSRKVLIQEGFDGEYGKIKVFQEDEKKKFESQILLFENIPANATNQIKSRPALGFNFAEYRHLMNENPSLLDEKDSE